MKSSLTGNCGNLGGAATPWSRRTQSEETLEKYADSTDFFRFSFVDVEGDGIDSRESTVHASDLEFSFDDTAGLGLGGI
ncbi:MAG: hypothetical protein ACLTW9_03785 [Enterocloster sp.]